MKVNTIINLELREENRKDTYLLTVDDATGCCSPEYINHKISKGIKNGEIKNITDIFYLFDSLYGNTYSFSAMNKRVLSVTI